MMIDTTKRLLSVTGNDNNKICEYFIDREYGIYNAPEAFRNLPFIKCIIEKIILNSLIKNTVIITHSSDVADIINIYLRLGLLKSIGVDINMLVRLKNLDILPEAAIFKDDVAVYFFDGREFISYDISEYGFYFNNIKNEQRKIDDINHILTDEIEYRIGDD